MEIKRLDIPEVILLTPKVFGDARGFFFESFNAKLLEELTGINAPFVQDNHSRSIKGTLRGLHYQLPPKSQGKLIRVAQGEVFDVAVDLRPNSPTFGKWAGTILSGENKQQLWIPPGFAHGFLTLSESADFLYKATDYYAPQLERGIRWDDPSIGIKWPLSTSPILSDKDQKAPYLKEADLPKVA